MKRYIIASRDLNHDVVDDRMSETPAEAVGAYYREAGCATNFDYVQHAVETAYRLPRDADLFEVYEVPGRPVENLGRGEVSGRVIASLFDPVVIVECVERVRAA